MVLHDPWTVEQLTSGLRQALEHIKDTHIIGRVARASRPSSGHAYFEIIGETGARMNCVAWKSSPAAAMICDGDAIIHVRAIDFYAPQGRCQAIVHDFHPSNEPSTSTPTERILSSLKNEGALDRPRRSLPDIVHHLGIVTSKGSAAHADMIDEVSRRWPGLRVTVVHTLVQGRDAPRCIERAIRFASRIADVVVCGRGGGSAADLAAFDEEVVARAILAAQCPIISAVGHETDHSIADAVADVRAKTPTAAIEIVLVRTLADRMGELQKLRSRILHAISDVLSRNLARCSALSARASDASRRIVTRATRHNLNMRARVHFTTQQILERHSTRMGVLRNDLRKISHTALKRIAFKVEILSEQLQHNSPQAAFRRGFVAIKPGLKRRAFEPGDTITLLTETEEVQVQVIGKRCRQKTSRTPNASPM